MQVNCICHWNQWLQLSQTSEASLGLCPNPWNIMNALFVKYQTDVMVLQRHPSLFLHFLGCKRNIKSGPSPLAIVDNKRFIGWRFEPHSLVHSVALVGNDATG